MAEDLLVWKNLAIAKKKFTVAGSFQMTGFEHKSLYWDEAVLLAAAPRL